MSRGDHSYMNLGHHANDVSMKLLIRHLCILWNVVVKNWAIHVYVMFTCGVVNVIPGTVQCVVRE